MDSLVLSQIHAKCNNMMESSAYLIKFVSNVYQTLAFDLFKNLVMDAFSKAWFSF
jgi:hypothetical protein